MAHPVTDSSLRPQLINRSLLHFPIRLVERTGAEGCAKVKEKSIPQQEGSSTILCWRKWVPFPNLCFIPRDIFHSLLCEISCLLTSNNVKGNLPPLTSAVYIYASILNFPPSVIYQILWDVYWILCRYYLSEELFKSSGQQSLKLLERFMTCSQVYTIFPSRLGASLYI